MKLWLSSEQLVLIVSYVKDRMESCQSGVGIDRYMYVQDCHKVLQLFYDVPNCHIIGLSKEIQDIVGHL